MFIFSILPTPCRRHLPWNNAALNRLSRPFTGILGAAEPSERAFWAEQIDTNPPKLLTDSLLNSAEFVNAFIGQSKEVFVRALHFNFFDRNINQPEINDWVARIEAKTLDLEQIEPSIAGNPLYAAKIGTGEIELVIITQQHGNEPAGTEGAL